MTTFRYALVAIWGAVPSQITDLVDKPDAYLIYSEYRGLSSAQALLDDDQIVGGWEMVFAGPRP